MFRRREVPVTITALLLVILWIGAEASGVEETDDAFIIDGEFRIWIWKLEEVKRSFINCWYHYYYFTFVDSTTYKRDRLIRVGQRTRDRAKWNSIMLAAYTGTRW